MLLEVKNCSCGYGQHKVIEDVSFRLSGGEILCLFGPNGVGKTTFFKTLLGFIKSISGEILIENQTISSFNRHQLAKKIAYVPQAHQTAFAYKVIDVVVLGRIAHMGKGGKPGKADYIKAWEALEHLSMTYLANQLYTQISGGERQMVLIARALAQDAKILILDEPTSNLDFGNQIKVLEHINQLKQKDYAIIMTTHSPDQVLLYGSKVLVFYEGSLMKVGKPKDILTQELIKEIYDVNVQMIGLDDQKATRICVPCIA